MSSEAAIVELKQLFSSIARAQTSCAMTCKKSSGCDASCCYISKMGGEPNLTSIEVALINDHLTNQPDDFQFYESGTDSCKFLGTDGKCKIYSARPIDCRTHFCSSETMESQNQEQVADLVNDFYLRHEEAYYHSELMYSCWFELETKR